MDAPRPSRSFPSSSRFRSAENHRPGRARIAIVDEHHAVADEDLVFDHDSRTDERVTGDFAAPPDVRVALNFDEGSKPGVASNLGIRKDSQTARAARLRRVRTSSATHANVAEFGAVQLPRSSQCMPKRHHSCPVAQRKFAASSTDTTRAPLAPSVLGARPLMMHRRSARTRPTAAPVPRCAGCGRRRSDTTTGNRRKCRSTSHGDALVVDPDLFLQRGVVVHQHLARSDDGGAADLVGVQPAHVHEGDDVVGEAQGEHRHVLDVLA